MKPLVLAEKLKEEIKGQKVLAAVFHTFYLITKIPDNILIDPEKVFHKLKRKLELSYRYENLNKEFPPALASNDRPVSPDQGQTGSSNQGQSDSSGQGQKINDNYTKLEGNTIKFKAIEYKNETVLILKQKKN